MKIRCYTGLKILFWRLAIRSTYEVPATSTKPDVRDRKKREEARVSSFFLSCGLLFNALFWRLPTLPLRVPSALVGLTSVFGMRTGITPLTSHQNNILNVCHSVRNGLKREYLERFRVGNAKVLRRGRVNFQQKIMRDRVYPRRQITRTIVSRNSNVTKTLSITSSV